MSSNTRSIVETLGDPRRIRISGAWYCPPGSLLKEVGQGLHREKRYKFFFICFRTLRQFSSTQLQLWALEVEMFCGFEAFFAQFARCLHICPV